MLDRGANRGTVELAGGKGQSWVAVEVLNPRLVEKRVFRQRLPLGADPDNAAERRFGRQMRDPSGHHVENCAAGRQYFAIEVGDGGDGDVVDMGERGFLRERRIGCRIGRCNSVCLEWFHESIATHVRSDRHRHGWPQVRRKPKIRLTWNYSRTARFGSLASGPHAAVTAAVPGDNV